MRGHAAPAVPAASGALSVSERELTLVLDGLAPGARLELRVRALAANGLRSRALRWTVERDAAAPTGSE